MTSRERVLAAIAHREPDRVPIDCGATPSSNISAIAYNNLKAYLGIADSAPPTKIYDIVQQQVQPDDWFLERFGVDVIDVGRAFNTRDEDWADADGYSCRTQYPAWFKPVTDPSGTVKAFDEDGDLIAYKPPSAPYFDQGTHPYEEGYPESYDDLDKAMAKVHWAKLAHSPWDHAHKPGFWEDLRNNSLKLRRETDKALMIVCCCNLFEWGTFLRRMDNFIMDLLEEPEEVEALLDALMERHLATLEKVCKSVGDVVDIIRFGDDLGMDTGPFMSPQLYRDLFKPRHKQLYDYVKANSSMKVFLHSCGSIYRLLPDLVDIGLEILNPVQTQSADMDAARLKAEFGEKLTFWGGGADTRKVLNSGTPEQVRADVLRRCEIFAPGGGFVWNTIHNITPDVPPQNIIAMFDAVKEFNGNS
jgi:uroporphyrinogen decarboxylase